MGGEFKQIGKISCSVFLYKRKKMYVTILMYLFLSFTFFCFFVFPLIIIFLLYSTPVSPSGTASEIHVFYRAEQRKCERWSLFHTRGNLNRDRYSENSQIQKKQTRVVSQLCQLFSSFCPAFMEFYPIWRVNGTFFRRMTVFKWSVLYCHYLEQC